MKKILFSFSILITCKALSQIPEDAVRYSWFPNNGSARNMAVGGVMGSLGGDITATFVNPAGLGFYRTREVVFTPGFLLNKNKANYRDSLSVQKKNGFNFGPTGVVEGWTNKYNHKQSSAVSLVINQTANFNNRVKYGGLNSYSSYSEIFAEEFSKSNRSIDDVLQTQSEYPYTSAPALYTYLIDTVRVNGALQVKAAPEYLLDAGQALRQEYDKKTSGGMYELALGLAQNNNDKWLYGITLGVPFVYYKSNTIFSESDTSSNTHNNFQSFTYNDNFKSVGIGGNLKIGVIYRPKEYIRFGFAVHSPSIIKFTDTHSSFLTTIIESNTGVAETYSVSSNEFTNGSSGKNEYLQTTPWKAMISGSYVFREVENTKRQRGFISADIEYVNHRSTRFISWADEPTDEEKAYYRKLDNVIKHYYKGAFNFRVGGEVKFNTIMGRLGFAYYGSPYKDAPIKANRMLLSGGLGYRNKGFFIDLTYVHQLSKDSDFAYRLEDRANTYASLKQRQGNIVVTVGFKY
ncbi:MAG: hypothetical protein ABIY51_04675 [Ferruginibacter sp.]